jgi:hypothetical protein
MGCRGKIVTRMRLEGENATGHAALLGFTPEQRQHGLMAPMHAIKITDRKGTSLIQARVLETAKKLH